VQSVNGWTRRGAATVTVRYELSEADGLRFCEYHIRHSPIVGRRLVRDRYLYPILGVVAGALNLWATGNTAVLAVAAFFGAAWSLWWPGHWRRRYLRQVSQTYAQPENQHLFGEQSLTLNDDGLTVRSPSGAVTEYPWEAIWQIDEEPGFLYVYLDGLSAITIPAHGLMEGDFDALRAALIAHAAGAHRA
jgi:hypothetical protein